MASLFYTLVLFSLASCTKMNNNMQATMNNDSAYTYLALGDSYTIGESVMESERFPAQTVTLLKQDGININAPEYIAKTGWTTTDLSNAIATQNPMGPFSVVSLLIGVNDQYQGMDTAGYRIRFASLLEKAISLAGNDTAHVFVLSIPDYSVTPFAANRDTQYIRMQIDEFNAINKEITLAYNVSYTDITPSTREAKTDGSLVANDGLHPSGKEYAKWAQMLAPKMEMVLK